MSRVEAGPISEEPSKSEQRLMLYERFLMPSLHYATMLREQALNMLQRDFIEVRDAIEIIQFADVLQDALRIRLAHGLDLSRFMIPVPDQTQEFIASVLNDPTRRPISRDPHLLSQEREQEFYAPLFIPELYMHSMESKQQGTKTTRWQRRVVGKGLLPKPLKTL